MVLDFGLLQSSLFTDSENLGVGVAGGLETRSTVESYNGKLVTVSGTSDISLAVQDTWTDITNMTYTILQDGLYLLFASITLDVASSNARPLGQVRVRQNSTTIGQSFGGMEVVVFPDTISGGTVDTTAIVPILVDLKTGDVIKMQWHASSTTSLIRNFPTSYPDGHHRKMVFCRLWSNN